MKQSLLPMKMRMESICKANKTKPTPVGEQNQKLIFINYIKNKYAEEHNINYDYVFVLRPESNI